MHYKENYIIAWWFWLEFKRFEQGEVAFLLRLIRRYNNFLTEIMYCIYGFSLLFGAGWWFVYYCTILRKLIIGYSEFSLMNSRLLEKYCKPPFIVMWWQWINQNRGEGFLFRCVCLWPLIYSISLSHYTINTFVSSVTTSWSIFNNRILDAYTTLISLNQFIFIYALAHSC